MHVYVSVGVYVCVGTCLPVCVHVEDQKLTLGVYFCCSPTWFLRQTPPWVWWCSGFLLGWLIRKPLGSVCFHTSVLELQEHAATPGFHGGPLYRSSVPHAYAKSSLPLNFLQPHPEHVCLIIPLLPLFSPLSTLRFSFSNNLFSIPHGINTMANLNNLNWITTFSLLKPSTSFIFMGIF